MSWKGSRRRQLWRAHRLWNTSQGRKHKSYRYSCEKWPCPAVSAIAVQKAGQFNDILIQGCPPRTCSLFPKPCYSRALYAEVSEVFFVLGLWPGSWRLLFQDMRERIFKGISHQKSKGMKNLTLCAAWPLSPSCSGFPFRTAKPYPSCLAINPVCSHQRFSWKKQCQWSLAMSKSTFNCDTAWSCSKVGVAETRSALRCVTAVLLIKWSTSNFARVSHAPPPHLSTGDQSHHQTLWLPEQVISTWPSSQQQMASDFVWVSTDMQCEEQFPRNHGEGRGKVWSEVFFLKLLMGGKEKNKKW